MQFQPTPGGRRLSRVRGSSLARALRLTLEALERRELLSGTRLGVETRVAPGEQAGLFAQTFSPLSAPTVAVHDDSSFAIAYTNHDETALGDEVYLRRFDSDRSPALFNDLVPVDSAGVGDQDLAVAAPLPEGGVVVAWYDRGCAENLDAACIAPFDDIDALFARRFDGAGEPLDEPWQVNDDVAGGQSQVSVATDDLGNMALAWTGRDPDGVGGVWMRRYDSQGGPREATDVRIYTGAVIAESPTIALDDDGNIAVAWSIWNPSDGSHETLGRFFAVSGESPIDISIAAVDAANPRWPSLAMSDDGGFVVAFTQDDAAGATSDVFARRFAPDAAAIDDVPFRVNTSVAGDQEFGRVAVAADGSFIIAWSGSGEQPGEEDASGIFLQGYDQAGDAVGDETRVNSTLDGDQFAPSIGVSAIGDAVVAWSGFGNQQGEDGAGDQSDDEGVFFQQVEFVNPKGEIDVRGNGISIVDGDATPSAEDGTLLGTGVVNEGRITRTFVVHNIGDGRLWFLDDPGITVVGGEEGEFTVEYVAAANIGPHGSLAFTLSFSPAATGLRRATIVILTDDGDETPFEFDVEGIGLAVARPWQNPNNPYDVNGDGVVSGLDVLIIINHVNRHGPHELAPPNEGDSPPPYLDVNGDNRVSPLDALATINLINSRRPPMSAPQPSNPSTNQLSKPTALASTPNSRSGRLNSVRSTLAASPADAVFAAWTDVGHDRGTIRKLARRA